MMGIGFAEFMVIGVVALLVFGPDRLPDFARQAGRMVRQVRTLSRQARDDIRSELGPDYADFELTDLDPRRALRKHIVEAWDEDDDAPKKPDGQRTKEPPPTLRAGEVPPYDVDAT
jgi:sec-independent protein translocase protein TatB